jgi:type I restriction enzyme, S subunit
MIDGLTPYPAMKDSGVPWLGEVPVAWKVLRGRHLFDIKKRIAGELGHAVFSVTQAGLRVKDIHSGEGQVSQDYTKYQIVKPGDFVMNSMDLITGGVGIAGSAGVTSPDYRVFAIRDAAQCRDRYVLHLFRMLYGNRGFYAWGQGSAQLGRWRLPRKRFNEFPFPVPPLHEQVAIVRFLDHADQRIRRYIHAKQKLIKLLEEERQAIIHRAVTRGLDPNIRLRSSGVEWVGDVPKHWMVTRVKNEFYCLNRQRVPLSGTERGLMTSRQYDYYGASGVIDKVDNFIFDDNLLLVAEDGANLVLRSLPLAIIARGKFWVNNHAHILKPKTGNLEFLAAILESLSFIPWISGAAQPKLTQDRLMSITIAVPPRDEQDRIVMATKQETAELRRTIDSTNKEIALLQEYRTRLIADLVTGKLDVREAAARLPQEAAELEPLDETVDVQQDDSAAEEADLEAADAA